MSKSKFPCTNTFVTKRISTLLSNIDSFIKQNPSNKTILSAYFEMSKSKTPEVSYMALAATLIELSAVENKMLTDSNIWEADDIYKIKKIKNLFNPSSHVSKLDMMDVAYLTGLRINPEINVDFSYFFNELVNLENEISEYGKNDSNVANFSGTFTEKFNGIKSIVKMSYSFSKYSIVPILQIEIDKILPFIDSNEILSKHDKWKKRSKSILAGIVIIASAWSAAEDAKIGDKVQWFHDIIVSYEHKESNVTNNVNTGNGPIINNLEQMTVNNNYNITVTSKEIKKICGFE